MEVGTSIEVFGNELASLLRLEGEDRFGAQTGLFDEWGLDSLQAFEMVILIESMAGALVPPVEIPELLTVGDAYGYYRTLVERESGAGN